MPRGISNSVVPFGKYKGQPIESDTQYCDWLMQQDWFRDKHTPIIVNNFGELGEHNRLQAMFLKEEFCDKIILAVGII